MGEKLAGKSSFKFIVFLFVLMLVSIPAFKVVDKYATPETVRTELVQVHVEDVHASSNRYSTAMRADITYEGDMFFMYTKKLSDFKILKNSVGKDITVSMTVEFYNEFNFRKYDFKLAK